MKPHVRAKNFLIYLLEALRQVRLYFLKQRIIRREHTFRALPSLGREPEGGSGAPRLLIVLTHVAGQAKHHAVSKHEKLAAVLTGVRESFAHLRYEIIVNTLPGRHIVGELPAELTAGLAIHEEPDPEPMLIEFRVQDLFAARRADFDWFLFLEDDVVIQDTLYLDKFQCFNRFTQDPKFLLMPNRYEITGPKTSLHRPESLQPTGASGHGRRAAFRVRQHPQRVLPAHARAARSLARVRPPALPPDFVHRPVGERG